MDSFILNIEGDKRRKHRGDKRRKGRGDKRRTDHQTPLFAAAHEGNSICADWLIAQGCAVDHADFRGETPLCIAFQNSQMEMIMKLLKHGASLGVKDV